MADSDKLIKVTIQVVVDQAKQQLAQLSSVTQSATEQLTKMGTGAQSAASGIDDGMKKASASSTGFFSGLTGDIVKGLASYDLLKQAASATFGFISDAVGESAKASGEWAQIKQNINNAGLSFDDLSGKLKVYSDAAIQMGFDDEETALSVSKLTLITHDYNQALQLNQLAMDLARSKNISLTDASHAIALVTQGNTRALKDYGIEMSETASIADVLNLAQQKVGGSAAAFADTTAGKLQTLQQQWDNIKQTVGDELMPTLMDLFKVIEDNLPAITAAFKGLADVLKVTIGTIGTVVSGVISVAQGFGETLGNISLLMEGYSLNTDDASKNTDIFGNNITDAKNNLNLFGVHVDNTTGKVTGLTGAFDSLGTGSKKSQQQIQDEQQALKDTVGVMSDLIASVSKFSITSPSDMAKFMKALDDTSSSSKDFQNEIKTDFNAVSSSIKSTQSDIDALKKKMDDLNSSFSKDTAKSVMDASQSMAQIIFDAQQQLPDLQSKLQTEQSSTNPNQDTITSLQKEIADKQKILTDANNEQFTQNKQLQDDLVTLKRQSSESELQVAFEKFTAEMNMKAIEHENEVKNIQEEINQKTAQLTAYNLIQDTITAKLTANVKIREKATADEGVAVDGLNSKVTALKTSYDNAAAAAAKLYGAGIGGISTSSFSISNSTPARASGGPVASGQPYLVGEDGPEMFTPNVSGSITPNNKVSAGSSTVININNPTVRSDQDLNDIIAGVEDALSRRDELSRMGAYK